MHVANHEGIEQPEDVRCEKPHKRSCGISFVTVHNSKRTESNTSRRSSCQCFVLRFLHLRYFGDCFSDRAVIPLNLTRFWQGCYSQNGLQLHLLLLEMLVARGS